MNGDYFNFDKRCKIRVLGRRHGKNSYSDNDS